MEGTSASEPAAFGRGDNDRREVRHGVGMDGEREHHRICEDTSGCEPVRPREFAIETPDTPPSVDNYAVPAAERCGKGLDTYAQSGNDTWGSQRRTSLRT